MIKKILVFALLFTSLNFQSQVIGKVIDGKSKEPISGAKVVSSDGTKLFSGADGQFKISPASYPITLVISMIQFVNDTLVISGPGEVKILLNEPVKDFQTVVISAGKRKQTVEEILDSGLFVEEVEDGLRYYLTAMETAHQYWENK